LTEFSENVTRCIAEWANSASRCSKNIECLEDCAKQLRKCLDMAFPNSKKIEFEPDKINYLLSSTFFLANRLAKATMALAEFDRLVADIEKGGKINLEEKENMRLYEKIDGQIGEILAKYF
jgi:hypothetical protein